MTITGARVQVCWLSLEEARAHPLLAAFFVDEERGYDGPYYVKMDATGNLEYPDFWPDHVVAVIVDGKVKIHESATEWHWSDVL